MKIPTSILGLFVSAFLLLTISLTTGCGGDGDDGEVFSPPAIVPDQLNYEISQGAGLQLTLTLNPSATITSTLLRGTFNRGTEAFTLDSLGQVMQVSAGDFLAELDAFLDEGVAFSNYQLHVISAAAWTGDNDPTSGEFEVVSADQLHRINIKVNNALPGVDITYLPNGSQPDSVQLTWQAFNDAFGNPEQGKEYAAIASFANAVLRLVYEQGGLVILTLELIDENAATMEAVGTIVEPWDAFPFPADDPTVVNPGESRISWQDVDNDQSIGSGDTVFVDFFDCWIDDASTSDTLFSGGIKFVNFIEEQSGGVITRAGFELVGGDHGFDFLRITETETDTQLGVVSIDPNTITLTGGFSMVFTSP